MVHVTRVIYEFQSDCHIFLLMFEIFIFPEQRPGMGIPVHLIQKLETRQRFFFTIPRAVKIHKVVPSHSFYDGKRKCFYMKYRPSKRRKILYFKRVI